MCSSCGFSGMRGNEPDAEECEKGKTGSVGLPADTLRWHVCDPMIRLD